MGGLFGSGSAQNETRYIGIQVQSSLRGVAIPRGWGTFKAGCNLLDYTNFYSQANSGGGKGSGGKGGGGGKSGGTTYSYFCNPLLGIAGQQIYGIRTVWRDSDVFIDGTSSSSSLAAPFAQAVYSLANQQSSSTSVHSTTSGTTTSALAQAGLSLASGANGQAVCSALSAPATTTYWMFNPNQIGTYLSNSHALGYSGMAYVYASNYALNSGATIPNHSFEVQTTIRQVIAGITQDDANPADIVNDFLPSVPQWPSGIIGSTTALQTYTLAAGLLISPYLDSQRAASDLLKEILACSNSDAVWSDGTLKFVPYGDTAITGNGVTFTPNLTPVYNLQLSDILDNGGDDPIKWAIRPQAQCYNSVQVEFYDRSNQYVTDIQPASDQANIDQYGLNKQDPVSLHSICLRSVAAQIAQLMVQRSSYIRRTCTFKLPETFGLLDPMDIVTVPLRSGGSRLVRIIEADEKDGEIAITAEEMLVGSTHAALYNRQTAIPAFNSYNADPGSAASPIVIHPPASLVSDNEVWIAAAHNYPLYGGAVVWVSTDGTNYNAVGTISGPSTYGVLTAALPVGSNPDTAHTLSVDMSLSGQALQTVTAADAAAGVTLAIIDNELIAFQTATVTGTNTFNLTTLQRGFGGTTIASHSSGAPIVFLNGSLFKYVFNSTQLGSTLYFKLQAFNAYGSGYQNIAGLTAYSVTLAQTYTNDVAWANVIGAPGTGVNSVINSEFRQGSFAWALNGSTTNTISAPSGSGYMYAFSGAYPGTLTSGTYFDPIATGGCWVTTFAPNQYLMPLPSSPVGTTLFASAMMGQKYCQAQLYLLIFDAVGTLLEAQPWTGATDYAADSFVGNGDPAHYSTVGGIYTITHSTARWAAVMVRGAYSAATNAANPVVYASRLQMGILAAGQTTVPAYQPGQTNPYGDQTAINTAAAITGQGPLATSSLTASQVANAVVATGNGNMIVLSQFEKGTQFWNSSYAGTSAPVTSTFSASPFQYIQSAATATASGQAIYLYSGYEFACTPGASIAASALIGVGTGEPLTASLSVNWYNASGTFISTTNIGSPQTNVTLVSGVVVAPAGAYLGLLVTTGNFTAAGGGILYLAQPMVTPATAGQTAVPAFTPGPVAVPGADVTATNTAAAITGQAATATSSDFSVVTGTTKPANNATVGATTGTNLTSSSLGTLSDSQIVTSSGTAAAITGQGALATSGLTAAQVTNTNISISSSGALSGAGGGAVTLGGLGAGTLASLNSVATAQITTGAVSSGTVGIASTATATGTSWTTVLSITVTPNSSSSAFIILGSFIGYCKQTVSPFSFVPFSFRVVNATNGASGYILFAGGYTTPFIGSTTGISSPTTFSLQIQCSSSSSGWSGSNLVLEAIELKV